MFPDELKLAKGIPIFISLDQQWSNTLFCNKYIFRIFERILYNKLITIVDKYKILSQNQLDFRPGHYTHHVLITLVDNISKSLDD